MKQALLIIFTGLFLSSNGQHLADSLTKILPLATTDTSRVNILNRISKDVSLYPERLKFGEEALQLAEKIDYKAGIVNALSNLGSYYESFLEDYATAMDHYKRAMRIAEQNHLKRETLEMYGQIFNLQIYLGNYPAALEVELKGLALAEKDNNKALIASFYGNIGFLYNSQNNLKMAEEYLKKFEKLALELNNENMLAFVVNNMAGIQIQNKQFDSALVSLFKALALYKKQEIILSSKNIDNSGAQGQIAAIYSSISFVKRKIGRKEESLAYADSCLQLCKIVTKGKTWKEGSSGINLYDLSQYYINFGEALSDLNEKARALAALTEGKEIAEHIKHAEDMKAAYLALSEYYAKNKQMNEAYAFHLKYSGIKDSVLNERNSRLISEMNAIYETEKKNKELLEAQHEMSRQQAENKQRATERNAFIAGFAIMFALAFFIYRGYRLKKKANEIIQAQKVEVEKQKHLVDDKNKEILDSIQYAKRIQNSLITSEKYIWRTLESLRKKEDL